MSIESFRATVTGSRGCGGAESEESGVMLKLRPWEAGKEEDDPKRVQK